MAEELQTRDEGGASDRWGTPLVRFPGGEEVASGTGFSEQVLAAVDAELFAGRCDEGRLDIERGDARLTCLIHRGRPFLAGLLEDGVFSHVPLVDFPLRARQMTGARWRLAATDASLVMMLGVHFCGKPALEGSTRWIDVEHVLAGLAGDRSDAAVVLERGGHRALLFLRRGVPARLYFGDPAMDPGEGGIADRLLLHAYAADAGESRLEVFQDLKLPADDDAGRLLSELAREARPPPSVDLVVRLADGRKVVERPFLPPVVTIGRDPSSDVFLDNLAVSRRHASLSWQRGSFVVRDLGSANGTRVGGRQINSAVIEIGDRIEIGKFSIAVEAPEQSGDSSATMMIGTTRSQTPIYLVGDEESVEVRGDVVIGKGRGVDAEARGFLVRRAHARLRPLSAGSFEVSAFGRARVLINGEKVARGRLTVGDRLTIGRSSFWLRRTPGDGRVPA